jgi:hypothetical protein
MFPQTSANKKAGIHQAVYPMYPSPSAKRRGTNSCNLSAWPSEQHHVILDQCLGLN